MLEVRDIIAPLLRDLPVNVRSALSRWYVSGDDIETICRECNLSQTEFVEMKRLLRALVAERRASAGRKPPVHADARVLSVGRQPA